MEDHNSIIPKLIVLLIAVSSAALIVALYHCIRVGWCYRRRQNPSPPQHRQTILFRQEEIQSSIDNSTIELIPAYKYEKGKGVVGEKEEDNTCAVCLYEFEEGDELRTLPECLHSFHVPCIDMWLYSHPNCPICRADATPSEDVLLRFLDSDEGTRDSIVSVDLRV